MLKFRQTPVSFERIEPRLLFNGVADVYTYHNDNGRTGADLHETVLTPANVNTSSFGKQFSLPVDGQIYAQPLYVSNLAIPGKGLHNVVFVATEHDDVYAFDSDTGQQLWYRSFIDPAHGITTVPAADTLSTDIYPEVGITGTPVIDHATDTMYLVTKEKITSGSTSSYAQYIRSIDLTTGKDKWTGSEEIVAAVPGVGAGYTGPDDSMVPFDPLKENQRPALTLSNGEVYVGYSSHGDNDPYHGWLFAFNTKSLAMDAVLNLSPDGLRDPIWQGGAGVSVDATGNIYAVTGNGTFDVPVGGRDYGDSIVRLNYNSHALSVSDYFTPYNQAYLNSNDKDLGSSGLTLLPGGLGLTGGKGGVLYLVNLKNLGGFNSTMNDIVQTIPNAIGGNLDYSTAAYFNGAVYLAADTDTLKAFKLVNGKLDTTPFGQSSEHFEFPGATPSISANGSAEGIVWAIERSGAGDTGAPAGTAILHAYNAATMQEIYKSSWDPSRDGMAPATKFSVPTIADGHVFVGTTSALEIFGLLPAVKSIVVVNTATGKTIETLSGRNAVIKLSDLPASYAIEAILNAPSVGSVKFSVGGLAVTDNTAPYLLDGGAASYTHTFATGKHTITVNPFDLTGADGFEGTSLSATYSVIA